MPDALYQISVLLIILPCHNLGCETESPPQFTGGKLKVTGDSCILGMATRITIMEMEAPLISLEKRSEEKRHTLFKRFTDFNFFKLL